MIKWAVATVLLLLTLGLGYGANQSDFYPIIICYGLFFAAYIFIFKTVKDQQNLWFFIGLALVLRFSLLWDVPNLSDDIYRFIWDGRLWLQGYNPFDRLPSYYIENNISVLGLTTELYQQLNSPHYFTIYPPIAQLNFLIGVYLFPNSIQGSAIVMKCLLFLFEIGNILIILKLLKAFKRPAKNVLLYGLNPLIIIEITGNLHFEGAMIFFLLLSLYLMVQQRWQWSAVVFALSIASKLLPLMFLPFFIFRLGWRRSLSYFALIGVVLMVLFLPLFSGVFLNNFGDSLNLYFQKFEFNASVYYLLRWFGYQCVGYNLIQQIGPVLAMGTLTGIIYLFLKEGWKQKTPTWSQLPEKMLFAITLYLAFTIVVHPWYTALPVVLCLFTRFRYPILWSGLIVLTYINYSYPTYCENLWMVGLEYGLVGLFLGKEFLYKRSI